MNDFYSMLTPEFLTVILLPALIGGIAVTLCSSLLGVSLVLKRYSMIGDGLSHVGFGALSVAAVMNLAPLKVAIPVVILAAVFLLRLSEHSQLKGDSAIAIFSTSALAIGVLVSSKAGLTNDVSHYMFGSILAMSREDVLLSVVLSLLVIAAYLLLYHKIYAITFDEDFAKATGTNVRFYNLLLAVLTVKSRNTTRFATTTLAPGAVSKVRDRKKPNRKQTTDTKAAQITTLRKLRQTRIAVTEGKIIRLEISSAPIIIMPSTMLCVGGVLMGLGV